MAAPTGEALNVAPRPVFWEELDFLGLNKLGWSYPHSKAPLLWACGRRYYHKGELVFEVKGGNLLDLPQVNLLNSRLELKPIDVNVLSNINEDSLFLIEHEAMEFISNVFDAHKHHKNNKNIENDIISYDDLASKVEKATKTKQTVIREECGSFDIMPNDKAAQLGKVKVYNSRIEEIIVSFSGGKDSQVVLDLTTRVLPEDKFRVIYSDTGYELPSSLKLYDELKAIYQTKYPQLEFHIANNHKTVLTYWDELDTPSKIHRWCCAVMKTAPLYRLLKKLHGTGKQPNVLAFEGVRSEESESRSSYDRIGVGVKHNNVVNARPIFDWSVTEVWLYLLIHNLPINPAYRKGLNRVGCVICPLSSELGDCLDYHFFPEKAQPFVDKLRLKANLNGIKNIDTYIKERKWKVRAGGNSHNSNSEIHYSETNGDFKAILKYPLEKFLEWLKILGQYQLKNNSSQSYSIVLNHKSKVYNIHILRNENYLEILIPNSSQDIIFISNLKKILNKTTYCVHCEVCEIECPTGALSVVPKVSIDFTKCVHCLKCINFKDNGCIAASSIKVTQGINNMNKNESLMSIKKFNTFGFRKAWVKSYIDSPEKFFDEATSIINTKKQLPIFVNWMIGAGLFNPNKTISELGNLLLQEFSLQSEIFWEIAWIELSNNTELGYWYNSTITLHSSYSREELSVLLQTAFPNVPESSRDNTLKALLNTLKDSPLGAEIKVGVVSKSGGKPIVSRGIHNELSLVAAAYSLYKYAEKNGRYSFTLSELYNPEQKEGIVKQFGIEREALEQILRSLEQDHNQVLRSELKMGLDNIILREDLNSKDIVKLLL